MPPRADPDLSAEAVAATLVALRGQAPLVHNITSAVAANLTANALLAVGASPAMVEDEAEVAAFVARSAALVVNLGSLTAPRAGAIRVAARAARAAVRPWVLDPVAVGVHAPRAALARDLIKRRPTAIRGNASEIIALAGGEGGGKGADTDASSDAARASAVSLARTTRAIVAVTGVVDYVTDGARTIACHNGHRLMTRVTGLGCAASALVGACLAVDSRPLIATAHAIAIIGVAGEIAIARSPGPGAMPVELLDVLSMLDQPMLAARLALTDADPVTKTPSPARP